MSEAQLRYWTAGVSIGAWLAQGLLARLSLPDSLAVGALIYSNLLFQGLSGLVLLLAPWRYDAMGGVRRDAERAGRPFYIACLVVNVAFAVWYAALELAVAPRPGLPPLGAPEVALIAIELALLGCFLALVRRTPARARRRAR